MRKYKDYIGIQVSLVHSVISGVGACYALTGNEIWSDLINFYSPAASNVLQISTGYFLFDICATIESNNYELR